MKPADVLSGRLACLKSKARCKVCTCITMPFLPANRSRGVRCVLSSCERPVASSCLTASMHVSDFLKWLQFLLAVAICKSSGWSVWSWPSHQDCTADIYRPQSLLTVDFVIIQTALQLQNCNFCSMDRRLAYLVYLVPGSGNQKLDAGPVPCRGLVSSHVFILETFCLNLLQRIRPFTSTRRQATICNRSSASFVSCWLVWSWQIDRSQICTKDRLPRLLLSLAECAVEVAKSVEGIERVSRSFDLGSRRQVILPTDLPRYDSQDWSVLKL